MRKKLIFILALLFIIAAINITNVSAQDAIPISAHDYDGNFKAYYNNLLSVAAADIGDVRIVIAGDKNPSRLAIYTDDGENQSIDNVELESGAHPSKLEIYNNFLFLYNYNNRTLLKIYDMSDPFNIEFSKDFLDAGVTIIDDFSIAENAMFILSGLTVYKYDLTEEGSSLEITLASSLVLDAEAPSKLTAVSNEEFIIKSGSNTVLSDMQGNTDIIEIETFYDKFDYDNGILYYYNAQMIYAYDIVQGEVTAALQIDTSQNPPLSQDIKQISNFFVTGNKIYIADNYCQKIVSFNSQLKYDNFCLCSYSNDEGRFNKPVSVSVTNVITVCDDNRIQIFNGEDIEQIPLSVTPSYAFVTYGGEYILIAGNDIYKLINRQFVNIAKFSNQNVLDAFLAADDRLYILSDAALYSIGKDYIKLLDINDGLKICVNSKTGDIYILGQHGINMYDNKGNLKDFVSGQIDWTQNFAGIQTDFDGNIYLLCQNYLEEGTVIIKLNKYDDYSAVIYGLSGGMFDDINSLAFDGENGDMYFVSKNAHAIYKVLKQDIDTAVASDIPQITLPSDPEEFGGDYTAQVLQITGYPSTMFYPFDTSLRDEDFYPKNIAHEGEIITLSQGAKLLSIYDTGEYYLALYNNKLGFVLKDKAVLSENVQPSYTNAEVILNTAVYSMPYIVQSQDNIKDYIEKWQNVTVIHGLQHYDESSAEWLYIQYGEEFGYINAINIKQYSPTAQMNYISGKLQSVSGYIELYSDYSDQDAILLIGNNTNVKIYYYKGDYAFISVYSEGSEVYGYILSEYIAKDISFEKQKLGFLLLMATVCAAILFILIKRKYLVC